MHSGVYGATEQGKSTLMKGRAASLVALKQRCMTFDPLADLDWRRFGPVYHDADAFERALADPANRGRFVFIDEATALFDETRRSSSYPRINRLAMMGRHSGFTLYCASQYPEGIDRRFRVNLLRGYAFKLGDVKAAETVARDYGHGKDVARRILELERFHYLEFRPGQAPVMRKTAQPKGGRGRKRP